MVSKKDKNVQRLKRHKRIRAKISGTPECPRLAVYRSNKNISCQQLCLTPLKSQKHNRINQKN